MSELKQLGLELGQILQLAPLLLLLKSGVEGHLLTLTNHQSQTVLDLVESPAISRFINVGTLQSLASDPDPDRASFGPAGALIICSEAFHQVKTNKKKLRKT